MATPLRNLWESLSTSKKVKEPRNGLANLSALTLDTVFDDSKTDEERKMILRSIYDHAAFTGLSNDQKSELVDAFCCVHIKPGDILFKQGDYGHYFYIMAEGECELFVRKHDRKSYRAATLHKGSNFGELALIYNGYRRATVVATKETTLYALDRHTFVKATRCSNELKLLFDKHATIIDVENSLPGEETQRYMNVVGFVKAMTQHREILPEIDYEAEEERLAVMFRMVDRSGNGMINFAEFALFSRVLSSPDPEFDLAFYYFDRNSENSISKDAFIDILKSKVSNKEIDNSFLDFECETIKRFFGDGQNQRSLPFNEFAEFFIQFQIDYAQQSFNAYDHDGDGSITIDEFNNIAMSLGDPRAHLYSKYMEDCVSRKGHINFAEFVGFQKFLQHLPAITRLLRATFVRYPESSVNINNFRALMRNYAVTTFSPIEALVVFRLFGTDGHTLINAESFKKKAPMTSMTDEVFCRIDGSIEVTDSLFATQINDKKNNEQQHGLKALTAGDIDFSQSSHLNYPKLPTISDLASNPMTLLTNLVLATISSCVGLLGFYPIDAVKTRMQYNRKAPLVDGFYVYKNSLDCFKTTLRQQGFRGLYRGALPSLIGVMPEKTVKIWCNHHLRVMFGNSHKDGINVPLEVLAGAMAGAAQVVITNPMELLKIRMQLAHEYHPSSNGKKIVPARASTSLVRLLKQLRISGLYQGIGPTLLRDVPFSAMYFPLYASLKERMSDSTNGLSVEGLLLAGAGAVVPAAFLTTPMDVVKTRMQAVPITTDNWKLNKELKYRNLAECFSKIYKHEGWRAFFKGAGSRVCFWSPQFAVTLLGYEVMLQAFAPDLERVPLTHLPITDKDLSLFRAESVRSQLTKMDHELRILR